MSFRISKRCHFFLTAKLFAMQSDNDTLTTELMAANMGCETFLKAYPGLPGCAALCRMLAGVIRREVLLDTHGQPNKDKADDLSVEDGQMLAVYSRLIDVAMFADASAKVHGAISDVEDYATRLANNVSER